MKKKLEIHSCPFLENKITFFFFFCFLLWFVTEVQHRKLIRELNYLNYLFCFVFVIFLSLYPLC